MPEGESVIRTAARHGLDGRLPRLAILASSLVLGGSIFWPAKNPPRGLWAFFFYDDFPVWLRIFFALAPILLAWLIYHFLVKRPLSGSPVFKPSLRLPRWLSLVLLILLFFSLFWGFREMRLWGDGAWTVRMLEGRHAIKPLGRYFWKEPLDRLAAMLFYRLGRSIWGWGARSGIALMNCLAGSLFVLALWAFARRFGQTLYDRLFIFSLVLSMGAAQLFFGHVENYTLVTLFIMLFILAGAKSISGTQTLCLIGLLAAIAVAVHPLASFLFAPLLLLLFFRMKDEGRRGIYSSLAAMVPGIIFLVVFYFFCRFLGAGPIIWGFNRYADNLQVFLTPSQALSWQHIWAVIQNYVLTLPLGIFLIAPYLLKQGIRLRDRMTSFLLVNSLSFFFFSLSFNHSWDRMRDWDLFAPAALPVALLAAYAYTRAPSADIVKKRIVGIYAVLFSLSFTVPWIVSNHLFR